MKSYNHEDSLKRRPNLFLMLAAVLAATAMWYMVSVRDRLEAQVEVNIDYYGIPQNLVVTEGLVSKLMVRLRGPETLLRSMPRQSLNDAVNLSGIKKGVTIVPLAADDLGAAFRAFEVVDIQPPRIVVTADTLIERSVPIRATVESPLKGGALTVENVSVSPATVILRGPEDVISNIRDIPVAIQLDPRAAGDTSQQTVTLDTPSLVTATPPSVRVQYTITSGRTVVSRRCEIKVAGDASHNYEVEPPDLAVLVEVPEALAKSASYLDQLEVSVVPPPMETDQNRKVRLRYRLPDGMTLLNPASDEVLIKRVKK